MIPELAARAHLTAVRPTMDEALKTAMLRQRLERSDEQVRLLMNQNQQRNVGRDGFVADCITATATASNSNKQYFRVGETLPNGYTLASVTS